MSAIDTTNIDETKPEATRATTSSVRANFSQIKTQLDTAKTELGNLSGVNDQPTARTNLGLGSSATQDMASGVPAFGTASGADLGTDPAQVPRNRDLAYVDVRSYGAVGDGVADDTTAIQAAIDHAASSGIGRVVCPVVCRVSTLAAKSNVIFDATGGGLIHVADTTTDMFTASAVSNFSIIGGRFDGNKANQSTAGTNQRFFFSTDHLNPCGRLSVEGAYMTGFTRGSLKFRNVSHVRVVNNWTYDNGKVGWGACNDFGFPGCTDVVCSDNQMVGPFVSGGDNVGIILESVAGDMIVTGNYMTNYASEFIQVLNYYDANGAPPGEESANKTKRAIVANNRIKGINSSEPSGIHLGENATHVVCEGNIVTGIGSGAGIELGQWCEHFTVRSNLIFDCQYGITGAGDFDGNSEIVGNLIRDCQKNGIEISGNSVNQCRRVRIVGNKCANNGKANDAGVYAGIKLSQYCEEITVEGNECYDTSATKLQHYGIIIGATGMSGRLILRGNDFRGNATAAGKIDAPRYLVLSIDNMEDNPASPVLNTLSQTYSVGAGGVASIWTAPSVDYNNRRWRFDVIPDNTGVQHFGTLHRGKTAAGDDMLAIENPSANTTAGTVYMYLEG